MVSFRRTRNNATTGFDDLQTGIIKQDLLQQKVQKSNTIKNVNIYIEQNLNEDCKVTLTGMPHLHENNDNLISSQFSSLILALVLVILISIVRSFAKVSILNYGYNLYFVRIYGIAHISFDIATVLVGSILNCIDYSIHIIWI